MISGTSVAVTIVAVCAATTGNAACTSGPVLQRAEAEQKSWLQGSKAEMAKAEIDRALAGMHGPEHIPRASERVHCALVAVQAGGWNELGGPNGMLLRRLVDVAKARQTDYQEEAFGRGLARYGIDLLESDSKLYVS